MRNIFVFLFNIVANVFIAVLIATAFQILLPLSITPISTLTNEGIANGINNFFRNKNIYVIIIVIMIIKSYIIPFLTTTFKKPVGKKEKC